MFLYLCPKINVENEKNNHYPNNKPNYDVFNWDNVANDWLQWLNEN